MSGPDQFDITKFDCIFHCHLVFVDNIDDIVDNIDDFVLQEFVIFSPNRPCCTASVRRAVSS